MWAPPPDPEPADYNGKAARAERMLASHLYETGGYLSGKSLSGVGSKSYDAKGDGLRTMAKAAMGAYYKGARVRVHAVERA
jgi:hypothetical protein